MKTAKALDRPALSRPLSSGQRRLKRGAAWVESLVLSIPRYCVPEPA
jgi:hypothetical protein